MAKPIVAIVGRPNVGKSTFFNKMAGRRVSIVNDMPGVTRDRIYVDVEWCGYNFTMVDTGGIELKSEDQMWRHIRKQAELAVDIADVILLFVDGKTGIMADDYDVAHMLRCTNKPVVLAVNKVDGRDDSVIHDFWALNLGEPMAISAEQSLGLGDLLDAVCANFEKNEADAEEETIKIAIVGKPNSGKSSLTNRLLGFERVIVSNIAGTTRDAIDTPFEYNGKKCTLIDTAGIRKKSKVEEDVEYQPTCIEDIVAGVSMYRPGPMDSIPRYVHNKHNPEDITYDHPILEPILKVTYGCIVSCHRTYRSR